jgi:hypothetical protein
MKASPQTMTVQSIEKLKVNVISLSNLQAAEEDLFPLALLNNEHI